MIDKWKKYVVVGLMSLIIMHFGFICLYLIKPTFYSALYTQPFFQQNWNLFVPPPSCNYNLYICNKRYQSQNIDIFNEIVTAHQKNRFSGYEPLLTALSNSIHYFEKEALELNFNGGKVVQNKKFLIIERFALNYLKHLQKGNLNDIKIILCVKPIDKSAPRVYYN